MDTERRDFLASVPLALAGAALLQPCAFAGGAQPLQAGTEPWPGYPRQDQDLVRDIVGASHGNEAKVRELLQLRPALVNAWWDWGYGDWESPLGAASHTGRKAIATLLLEHGARIDIFAATMLGQLDAVRSLISANPGVQRTRGPHGISLLAHARAGGEAAAPVLDYLTSLGEADLPEQDLALSVEDRKPLEGTYSFGPAETDRFVVGEARGQLSIQRPGQQARTLRRTGERAFSPAGIPSVTVRFEGEGLTILDGRATLRAQRGG